ncbi:MAG: isoprenylcysteine carboxylmethyltransferase family protein, partial [Proteobacteria bacterium]|nr:isoprenylcysteine carboxylmethyltransferase family protein [Pseudomonadota bacterium]
VTLQSTTLVAGASVFLLLTALRDEVECRAHFGADYADYMRRSKRFIPFVF